MAVSVCGSCVCVRGSHGVSMSSVLHLGPELRLLETSLRHPEPADEHPGMHMCEKSRTSSRAADKRADTGATQELPSPK